MWVITKIDPTDYYGERVLFYNGSGWSSEYPDAKLYPYREGYATIKSWYPTNYQLYKNYGTTEQRKIEPNSGHGY